MNIEVPRGEFVKDGEVVSPFSGRLAFDSDRERIEGYGVADNVRDIFVAADDKGRGLSLRYTDEGKEKIEPVRIHNASLKGRVVWFYIVRPD